MKNDKIIVNAYKSLFHHLETNIYTYYNIYMITDMYKFCL